jgi:hypothetical protein
VTAARVLRTPVPREILPLIAAVAIGGMLAGVLAATPVLFITTPVVAAALAAAAALGQRRPEWSRVAAAALAGLPEGQARVLLTDLLRRAAAVPASAHADPLVFAACEAARQLAALELHLAAFDAQAGVPNSSPRWRDALPRCQRGRDLLTERLQDASAALSRWQAAQGAGVSESLGRLARELNEESRYQKEAAQEVEALLA